MDKKNLYNKASNVVELTPKDFSPIDKKPFKVTNKNFHDKYGLITFYAPWCGHCKHMVETWSELALQFKYKFPFAAVNCENPKNREVCGVAGIRFYPTVKYVTPSGTMYDLEGPNDRDNYLYFVCSKI